MRHIKILRDWEIPEGETTPESVYMDRRRFLKGAGMMSLYSFALWTGCTRKPLDEADYKITLSDTEKKLYPANRNEKYALAGPLTQESIAASYNNFYEFTDVKEDARVHAQKLKTRPWSVNVTGLVHKPRTFDVDELLKTMPIEERIYRLRCVEAWTITVPWTGFPLKVLLDKVEPMGKATHVRMTSFYKPFTAQGQLAFWQPWPYTEGFTVQEAMNELAFIAVGIYGHPLPKQHGAPLRLVLPWKYAYKSIKSIVEIELVDYRPTTFWTVVQGLEYDFQANVNPRIPHPRWSQAPPSLESRNNATSGKYGYLSLPKRIKGRLLPVVKIADMNEERMEKKNFSILSIDLKNAIRHRLDRNEQVFLFLNRRGTANYVLCAACGYVSYCPRCSVSLTFHGNENSIRCHYCKFTTRLPKVCMDCGGKVIRFQGFGTQKLEKEVQRLFKKARLFRLDRDTTRKHSDFVAMFDKMTNGEIDILIGTQMITKGHDFPNVTLVGIVHADLSLNIPDFRSSERSFQLLTQVAGRAGRGLVPGQVIVQTWHPRHYVYDYMRRHDYDKFYEKEMQVRKKLNYPPFTKLIGMGVESESEDRGRRFVKKIQTILMEKISKRKSIELLGPSPAAVYRVNEKFRWHLILRSRDGGVLQSIVRECLAIESLKKSAAGKIKLTIDVDPVNLL